MVKVLFAGTPEVAVPSLRALAGDAEHFEVVAVLTRPDAPTGRGRRLMPSPVKQAALELGLPVIESDPGEETFLTELTATGAEAAAVVAYGKLLKQDVLDALPMGWYNLHFSLLPQWRGAAPVQRAIWAGDDVTGATVFRITRGMDAGPILAQSTVSIGEHETSGELLARLAEDGSHLLASALLGMAEGRIVPVEQPQGGVRRGPADSRLHAQPRRLVRTARARRCRAGRPACARRPPGRYDASRCADGPQTGHAARRQEERLDRHRQRSAGTDRGQGAGQEGDARRRLGARRPAGRGRILRLMTSPGRPSSAFRP